jgi:hypothetical protein
VCKKLNCVLVVGTVNEPSTFLFEWENIHVGINTIVIEYHLVLNYSRFETLSDF